MTPVLAAAHRLHLHATRWRLRERIEVDRADVLTLVNAFWAATKRADVAEAQQDAALHLRQNLLFPLSKLGGSN